MNMKKITLLLFVLSLLCPVPFLQAAEKDSLISEVSVWLTEMGYPPQRTADGQGLTFQHEFIIDPSADDRYDCVFITDGADKLSLVSLWNKTVPDQERPRIKEFIKILNTVVQTGFFELDSEEKHIAFVNSMQLQPGNTGKEDLFMMMSDNLHGFDYLINAFKEVLKGTPPDKVVADVKRKADTEEKRPEVDGDLTVG
jgi:hypothetical protein